MVPICEASLIEDFGARSKRGDPEPAYNTNGTRQSQHDSNKTLADEEQESRHVFLRGKQ